MIDRLTVEVKSAKLLYAQTMSSLEAISNRIHESRRLGHWLNSPLTSPRTRGVGSEVSNSSGEGTRVAATPALSAAEGRKGEEISASLSLPSSPRHTPPGQADTDTEADSEVGGGLTFFGSSYVATLRKSAVNPLPSDVVSVCVLTFRRYLLLMLIVHSLLFSTLGSPFLLAEARIANHAVEG